MRACERARSKAAAVVATAETYLFAHIWYEASLTPCAVHAEQRRQHGREHRERAQPQRTLRGRAAHVRAHAAGTQQYTTASSSNGGLTPKRYRLPMQRSLISRTVQCSTVHMPKAALRAAEPHACSHIEYCARASAIDPVEYSRWYRWVKRRLATAMTDPRGALVGGPPRGWPGEGPTRVTCVEELGVLFP